jgi:uncharacterized membrane protein YkoI
MTALLIVAMLAIAALLAIGAAAAFSISNQDDERRAEVEELGLAQRAKISLIQAISIAEQVTGGRAFGKRLASWNGFTFYEIELGKDNRMLTVRVDVQTGKLAKAVPGKERWGENID